MIILRIPQMFRSLCIKYLLNLLFPYLDTKILPLHLNQLIHANTKYKIEFKINNIIKISLIAPPMNSKNFAILIHGGCGVITKGSMTALREQAITDALRASVKAGYEIL